MTAKEFFYKMFKTMFPTKEKKKERKGVLGHYDCKPFDNFEYALKYANETELFRDDKILIAGRIYKNTTMINVLVSNEEGFDIESYHFENLKYLLEGKTYLDSKHETQDFVETKNNIVVVSFQHYNDYTISQCKKFCNSSKTNIEHAIIYNPKDVQMDYYKPVPKFYKIYDILCEDLYFDLGFIDDLRK